MISLWYTLAMLAKVILAFLLLFIYLPSRIIYYPEEADSFLDRFFISLTHSVFAVIILVHVLVFAKLYEFLSLLFCLLLIYLFSAYIRGKSSWLSILDALGMKVVVSLLDMSEGYSGFWSKAGHRLNRWAKIQRKRAAELLAAAVKDPLSVLLPLLVLLAAAGLRFILSLKHAAYPYPDPYEHLVWAKLLGSNQIYSEGIYQLGYHAVISAMSTLFFQNAYWIVRFIGALGSVVLVLSVYYFAWRVTANRTASLLALVVYGLVTSGSFPSAFYRQTVALPMEFGAVFIFPGLTFLWLYFQTRKNQYLILFAENYAITVLVHAYTAIYMTIWAAVLTTAALFTAGLKRRDLLKLLFSGLTAGICGVLPLGIGLLMGHRFWGPGVSYLQENIVITSAPKGLLEMAASLFSGNVFLSAAAFMLCLLIARLLIARLSVKKEERQATLLIAAGLSTVTGIILFRAGEFGLPAVMGASRTGVFLAPFLAVTYTCGLDSLEKILRLPLQRQGSLQKTWHCGETPVFKGFTLLLCLLVIILWPPVFPSFENNLEYDEAAENYLVIERDYPALDWTLVAPTEQYQQALGRGWHYEILRFVQDFTPKEAADPAFQFPIPTHHIFVFTEKTAFLSDRPVTAADAARELEREGDNPHLQYYLNPDQRTIIQAKAIRLVEAYRSTHEDVSVFYEDKNICIYHIYHEPPEKKTEGSADGI